MANLQQISQTSNLKVAAASNGNAAVAMAEIFGSPVVLRYAPASLGEWSNRAEFAALTEKAAKKLGWKHDRRCTSGWRKV